ncbi:MAG: DNA repair protein RecO [Anaerolineales bacterium]|nr:DNA repair protein RecO [Anaerolineales bacterium]
MAWFGALRYNTHMVDRTRVRSTHALILRRRDVADADRVLTVFTPGEGKIELLAKGVRKTTSRKAGHLEPFMHTALVVAAARTWDIITEASTVESFRHLRTDLDAISRAGYLCELLDAFTDAGDDNRALWDLVLYALRILERAAEQGQPPPANLLRWYDLQLLGLTGFQPQFFHCVSCEEELQPLLNFLSLGEGGVFCPRCGALRDDVEPIEVDTLKVLRYLQSRTWLEVERLNVRPGVARAIDSVLQRYLVTVLERSVRAADFIRRLEHDKRAS